MSAYSVKGKATRLCVAATRLCAAAAVALLAAFGGALAQTGTVLSSGPLFVTVLPVELRALERPRGEKSTDLTQVIARTVQELFSTFLRREFERGLDRKIVIRRLGEENPNEPIHAFLAPSVTEVPGLGVRVSVRVIPKSTAGIITTASELVEDILLAPDANFRELNSVMGVFSRSIAQRLADISVGSAPPDKQALPRGFVGFHCVSAADPGDPKLQHLARVLTLELPFHLTEYSRKRKLDIFVRGLGLHGSVTLCERLSSTNLEAAIAVERIENFTWFGTVSSDVEKAGSAQLLIMVSDRAAGSNFQPITAIRIDNPGSPRLAAIAEQAVDSFVKRYSAR